MTHKLKIVAIATMCISLSACASLKSKELKAPCGPTAGMTDPCGNRTPINDMTDKPVETAEYLQTASITRLI